MKLGDDPSALLKDLQAEFPAADFQEGDEALRGWLGLVLEYLEGERLGLDLPLDIQATAFQRRVWRMLQSIPYGETRSYQQMALDIGFTGNTPAGPSATLAPRILRRWSSPVIVRCGRTALSGVTDGVWVAKRPLLQWSIVRVSKPTSERPHPSIY